MTTTDPQPYNTLDEIRLRKEQLGDAIQRDSEQIASKWVQLFATKEDSTKGQYIATLVANSVTAIDAFLMVRKLMKNYGGLVSIFQGKKKRLRR